MGILTALIRVEGAAAVKSVETAAGDEGGHETSTSSDWATIDGLDVDVAAIAGDLLVIGLSVAWNNGSSASGGVTVAVGGTSIHPASKGWYCGDVEDVFRPFTGELTHVVQEGDISAGVVNVTGQFRRESAPGTFNIANDGAFGTPVLTVINMGRPAA